MQTHTKLPALQNVLAAIEHEFALESVTVHVATIVKHGISGAHVKPGTYKISDRTDADTNTLTINSVSPQLAHHLRSVGHADVKYKNGRVELARQLGAR